MVKISGTTKLAMTRKQAMELMMGKTSSFLSLARTERLCLASSQPLAMRPDIGTSRGNATRYRLFGVQVNALSPVWGGTGLACSGGSMLARGVMVAHGRRLTKGLRGPQSSGAG